MTSTNTTAGTTTGKLIHFVHQSLDGFIEGPNGEFDWPAMGPELSAYSQELTGGDKVFLYGRPVWEFMADYWPTVEQHSDHPHDLAFAPVWRKAEKAVVSRTLTEDDRATHIINTDVAERLNAMKAVGKTLLLFGGSNLAGFLTEEGVIDEYRVFVHPVLLGGGKPVFQPSALRHRLELVETRTFDERVVLLRHRRA
ncbi:dihydrofolate reductase family protein [Yinghuangia seranimata]|uniref:dihydrofolate reductase family protein n=1 Tax=Yinghuangia seranimata TaxID=408067 RepID=UPI00248AE705|nr:dihydrofolate reductase family protein [Yinghuangia seranimata]MDI2126980.1 dihydrofolate reductase family protein [Yinghuangia seranimata]